MNKDQQEALLLSATRAIDKNSRILVHNIGNNTAHIIHRCLGGGPVKVTTRDGTALLSSEEYPNPKAADLMSCRIHLTMESDGTESDFDALSPQQARALFDQIVLTARSHEED